MRRQLVLGTIGCLVAVIYLAGALDFVERHLHDLRSGILSRDASGQVVLVTIDRQSLQRLPGWPWPREYHAAVIERLTDAGAARIAVAIDFQHAIRSPQRSTSGRSPRARTRPGSAPVFRQLGNDSDEPEHVVEPLPWFRQDSALASADLWPDPDGLVRRFDLDQIVGDAALRR